MAEEYACVIDRGGKKHFTHRGLRILVRNIPSQYINDILSRAQDKRMTIEEDDLQEMEESMKKLEEKKKKLEEKITLLVKAIEEQKLKVEEKKINPPPPPPQPSVKPVRKSKPIPKKKPPPTNPIILNLQTKELFDSLGIKDEKDWKKWLLKNHPDKNPNADIDLVGMVNNRARVYFQKS
ncbi:Hypothetical protein BRZCDTV_445 [Brazilian cedratvirus IHUMI]|uniref:Uncharacterized protein n=1 Tax=Brazilian cedratvirus IHUMI TaxID=2126980 RepID=A0A2R8FF77_9VIRU|nr:Hypothetical protein BRZCDTV_445 [Brazilian cedratvirus IHUMI]